MLQRKTLATPTPAQLHAAQVLGALADRIDTALARHIKADQPVTDSMFVVQGFLREFRHTVGHLRQCINALGRAGGPLAGGEDAALPVLLDDIERQTWYLNGLVESFHGKRFGSPFSELRPYVAVLGETTLAQVRDLYRQFVAVVSNPPALTDGASVSLQMTLDVDAEVGRLIWQLEKLALGDTSGRGVDLSRPGGVTTRLSASRKPAFDIWPKFWPMLAILLGGFALGFIVAYYWAYLLIIGVLLLVLGLIGKYPWAVIIAMLLGGN
jgi:hypothetical protein